MGKKNNKSEGDNKPTKKTATQKGSVAFLYGGMLKTGCARVFWTEEKNPIETVKEHRDNYGPDVNCRYVNCENPEKVYTKVLKNIGDKVQWESTVQFHATNLINLFKEVAGEKQAHRCVLNPKEAKSDKKDTKKDAKKDTKKAAKKGKKDGSEDEESEDEESGDEESGDESGEESGEESGSDDEVSDVEESENEESESEDEEPVAKKTAKATKSKKDTADKKKGKKK